MRALATAPEPFSHTRVCHPALAWGLAVAVLLAAASEADAFRRRSGTHENTGHLTFASPQSNPIALSADGAFAFVAATTSNRVDVINTATNTVIESVDVGLDPVALAVTPDGTELWVSNHVSDSVSVVDIDLASASFLEVVETVQDLDANGVTLFDEPVGIAFAEDGSKAYVALSSRNDIAVVDTGTYAVTNRLHVTAQDPRAIAVRGGRLFVLAFESGNRTEVSFCADLFGNGIVGDQCSLGLVELGQFVTQPNLPGAVKNIVVDPQVPDRDLFVFRTSDDALLESVEGVGTLLYGLAVGAGGDVFVTQTEARNAENGDDGQDLIDLQNRMFLNRITAVDCGGGDGDPCGSALQLDLEPAPPSQPAPGDALATPYGAALSGDGQTLVATAAASSRLFTWSTATQSVLGRLDVGSIPRGVALASDPSTQAAQTAYVLNTLGNTVSVVDVTVPSAPSLVATIPVGADPTPTAVRLGRIAFNDAGASTSKTFACASCHPDGHTDQLVWRIGGKCPPGVTGTCDPDGDEPRTTMPMRGLRDSLPLHWTGNLGDPFGGINGDTGAGGSGAGVNCTGGHDCFLQLVEESLGGVMCDRGGSCPPGGNELTAQEMDDMAVFLESVSYPPARSRRMNDLVSSVSDPSPPSVGAITVGALEGFEDFFFDQGGVGDPNTCADSNSGCHELPLGTSTNSETLQGFDAPTMRGLTDRFVQFSMAPTVSEEILVQANAGLNLFQFQAVPLEGPIQWDPNQGHEEITTLGAAFLAFEGVYGSRPLDIFQMVEEASTGFSGALGRQVTLNAATVAGTPSSPADAILDDLEAADQRGVVNLRGDGTLNGNAVTISYDFASDNANPYKVSAGRKSRAQMIADVQSGVLRDVTLTAHLRGGVSESLPQPLLAPIDGQCGAGTGSTGDPALPSGSSIAVAVAHVGVGDEVFLNGQPTGITVQVGDVSVGAGAPGCGSTAGVVTPDALAISGLPVTGGTDLLQIRTVEGLLSNEMPVVP